MIKVYFLFTIWLTVHFGFIQPAYSKPAMLYGTCSDNAIDEINIISFSQFWWNNEPPINLGKGDKLLGNSFLVHVKIDKQQKVQFQIHGKSWNIFVSPGDSIHFIISQSEGGYDIIFSGKNSANYNYYNQLSKVIRPDADDPRFEGDSKAYQEKVNIWHNKKLQFLSHFKATNQLTKYFNWFATTEINYERGVLLYRPLQTSQLKIQNVSENYFNDINALEWNDERLLEVGRFNVALVLRYIYCFTEDPWHNLDKIRDNINQSFTGKIREYLICSMINIYAKKQSEEYHDKLIELIKMTEEQLTDSTYIKDVAKSKVIYLMLNKAFPEHILASTYLMDFNTNKRLTLAELLKQYEGNAVYIDFWASWCGACRVDISESEQAKEFLKSKNVSVIYISIDKDKDAEKWRRASVSDKVTVNQYLLENNLSAPLSKYLSLNFIPRYVLLNRKHLAYNIDAPRINQNNFTQLKETVSKMQIEIVTFK